MNTQTVSATEESKLEKTSSSGDLSKVKIAMVEHSFTNAAYKYNQFYTFYAKYGFPPEGTEITNDLNMLTSTLPHGPIIYGADKPSNVTEIPGALYFKAIHEMVLRLSPDAQIVDLRDEDVHEGKIFDSDGRNMYDIIFLFHQEYVTAEEYQNLRIFVENGGTLIFADANFLTVEVKYSKEKDSITFVKGHNWEFDGKVAKPSVPERWLDETREWVGSNFLTDPVFIPITFRNNPFNYTHTEENYVNNPNDIILIDYKTQYPGNHRFNPTVATYELSYGKGKIIVLGFFAHIKWNNPNLMNFFENVILPRAVGNIFVLNTTNEMFPIYSLMQSGQISQIDLNPTDKTLNVNLKRTKIQEDSLRIVLPHDLLGKQSYDDLRVKVNNKIVSYNHFSDDIETGFEIPLPQDGNRIQLSPIFQKTNSVSSLQMTSLNFSHNYECASHMESFICDLMPNEISGYDVKGHGLNVYSSNAVKPTFIMSMAFTPDGRLLFSEKDTGNIRIMKDDKVIEEPFFHVSDSWVGREQGLLGITIDPKFEENHFVYFYYTYHDKESDRFYNKVVRIVDVNDKGENPLVILDKIYATNGFHSGGAMAFGTDDKLYIVVGDATEPPFAMDPNILIGKVLRINRDGTIPSDNPNPTSPVYNIGHRNMFGIAFDHGGFGIVTENGDYKFDKIDDIKKGANYGYPILQPANTNPYLFDSSKSEMPLVVFHDTIVPTQAIYYGGNQFPDYHGKFLFGSFNGYLFTLDIDNSTKKVKSYDRVFINSKLFEPVIGLAQSPNGDIYYSGFSIYKLQQVDNEKLQSLFPVTVASNLDAIPFKEMDIIPGEHKIIIQPESGKKYLSTSVLISMPKSISNIIDKVTDINGTQLNFMSSSTPTSDILNIFVNYNVTSSNATFSPATSESEVKSLNNQSQKNFWDSMIEWFKQIFSSH